jgi:catechol 2,3-dioxygenase-like lactoylglutathione lyase family enzyme
MPVDERIVVVFETGDGLFEARLKPYEIVHDGIHHGIPEELRRGRRLTLRAQSGDDVYPDMFAIEVATAYGDGASVTLATTIEPITGSPGPWRNVGFDHLAITVADRQAAYAFFTEALQLVPMRHDQHMTVLTTGHTSLFLFDTGEDVPLSDGLPSRWHHLGFVVDSLDHAYYHLTQYAALVSDFTLLERLERWSLYGHYRNGDVTFMIQLSEIREGSRGFADASFAEYLYDYGAQLYGKRIPTDG